MHKYLLMNIYYENKKYYSINNFKFILILYFTIYINLYLILIIY